ncbi:MAG: hypothetical protein ACOYON_06645 [Fimbriimonas sp.]
MALTLSVSAPFSGSMNATYWRITGATFDVDEETLDLVVSGYVSQGDRESGRLPLLVRRYRAVGVSSADVGMATAYARLKAMADFQGATDA